jgi:hypothetical protein
MMETDTNTGSRTPGAEEQEGSAGDAGEEK